MSPPLTESLAAWPEGRPILLDNETCVYCGSVLSPDRRTREHVIGRRFVPRGTLDGHWNLIVYACRGCNGTKADLEDDISAITMQPDTFGRYARSDVRLIGESKRKMRNAFSRRTRKPVAASEEQVTIRAQIAPGFQLTANFASPPQIEDRRTYALARMQMMAFFYWITFDAQTRRGRFWRVGFHPVMASMRTDWGNPIQLAFMNSVVGWEPRVLAFGADGYFRTAIRRHPSAECWSWVVEWNENLRAFGFFGDRAAAECVVAQFPRVKADGVMRQPEFVFAYRTEFELNEKDDLMFDWAASAIPLTST